MTDMIDTPHLEDGGRDLIERIQAAVNRVDFEDVSSNQKREYCKAGARRVIRAINDAIKEHKAARSAVKEG
jgi:hypothetical protein